MLQIIGGGLIATTTLIYLYKNRDIIKVSNTFKKVCERTFYINIDSKNYENGKIVKSTEKHIPLIQEIKRQKYGYKIVITVPTGMNIEDLKTKSDYFKTAFRAKRVNIESVRGIGIIKIIINEYENVKFKVEKCKKNQLFLGYNVEGNPVMLDMYQFPNLLVTGAANMGKTKCIEIALTNLSNQYSRKEVQFYFLQVLKNDLKKFKNLDNTIEIADTHKQALEVLNKISKIAKERNDLFLRNDVDNLEEYNKKFKNKQLPVIYLVVEEIHGFICDKNDDEEIKELSSKIMSKLSSQGKVLRASGIYIVAVTQKATNENLPSDLKNNMTRLSTKLRDSITSTNAIGSKIATQLEKREFVLVTNDYEIFKTPHFSNHELEIYGRFKKEAESSIKSSIKDNTCISICKQLSEEEYKEYINKKKLTTEKDNKVIEMIEESFEDYV